MLDSTVQMYYNYNMKEEISCKNCRYYLVHYSKTSEGYVKTTCGHCTQTSRNLPRTRICEKWDKIENAIPANERILNNRLLYLEKHVEKIQNVIEILKDMYGKQ